MLQRFQLIISILLLISQLFFTHQLKAQFVPVGSGSYTTTFPGVDEANRNSFPSGTPQISKEALGKPVPTNDWWSALIKNDHVSNLFNYPMALKTVNTGLVASYIPWGVFDDQEPIIVGVEGVNASKATVANYSDWTVTMDWDDGNHNFQATAGIAMPFVYFSKNDQDIAKITVNLGSVTVQDEMLIVENARNDADFVFYAPTGSTWTQNGNSYTSSLNGKNYWSMAMLPQSTTNINSVASEYKKYAYVFPTNTTTNWNYAEGSAILKTDFFVETEVKEGSDDQMLIGLLPHQWANLAVGFPAPDKYSYSSVRGEIKTMEGNGFSVENKFYGILPTLPYLSNYSDGFDLTSLNNKVSQLQNEGLNPWTDSYNEGQMMNRLIQTARIADKMGNVEARDKMIATVKERLEDWLSAEASEVAFIFYYNSDWSALLGYPAGHGQDSNINDHHFHWGYFIHAAAFMEQYEPGWASQWGDMVNLLVRDAASENRSDDKFPFLRNFSPYAGHCWANGFASFPQGNDQESTSESMQFNSSLIHWGTITGNDEIRDLGIYLYTTEQTAIEEYWFDMHERNFSASQQYSLVSRVWGNSYDNGTFWTSDIAASYGIELYPIHGGSLYLGQNKAYVEKLWNEIKANTGVLNNQPNDNLWYDVMWEYLAFIDPQEAINLYNSYPDRNIKFGVSDAQTYYWLHSMNAMGSVDASITANYPIAAVFNKNGNKTYVAHNYTNTAITVLFSDGYSLEVPANSMATNKDTNINGSLSTSFSEAHAYGSVNLSLSIESGTPTKVAFYRGSDFLGEVTEEPFVFKAIDLEPGNHGFYAKIYEGENFGVSNIVNVSAGNQFPFSGTPYEIPGTFEAGNYDFFEGGNGNGISYFDASNFNEGNYREDEYVDVSFSNSEGATIGWINNGEWTEYTVNVQEAGVYELSFRYASNNNNGGGPFHLELDDNSISEDKYVGYTGGWDTWATETIEGLNIPSGEHILKVSFGGGEFNLGKMTFNKISDLPYSQPVANAGDNVLVVLPENTANLNASSSYDPDGDDLTYYWEQVYGPNVISFSDQHIVNPEISSLEEGVYLIKLTVSNGSYSDQDQMLVIVSADEDLVPSVSITSPNNNKEFIAGKPIIINASATDLDGSITKVEFFVDNESIGSTATEPYSIEWTGAVGEYDIYAQATDNEDNISNSDVVHIILNQPPSCNGTSHNGDFDYEFSEDANNPTLTFIPTSSGVGSPTCILYYGFDGSGNYAGYGVTPNSPFTINAEEGSTVFFYYTYSFPGQGEKNTRDNLISYVVGTCESDPETTIAISDKTLSLNENSEVGTIVTTIEASYNGSDNLTFSIVNGNDSGAFEMNASSGELKVADSAPLDFETTSGFTLEIMVTDGSISDNAIVTINLNDIDESITINDGTFSIDENSEVGTLITIEEATYNGVESLTYSIVSGNNANAFEINPSTGELKVTDSAPLDFETTPSFFLEVMVTDGSLSDTAIITINLNDLDEAILGLNEKVKNLKYYPNPIDNYLTIEWDQFQKAELYDLMGQRLSVSNKKQLNTTQLNSGVYILVLTNREGEVYRYKVLKK